MRLHRWSPPPLAALHLRAITRHLAALVKQHTAVANQLHANQACGLTPGCVRQDLQRGLRAPERSAERMRRAALEFVRRDAGLLRRFMLLQTVPGIGETSAFCLLAEVSLLPDGLQVRQ